MRGLFAAVMGFALLVGMPAFAAKTYPNDMSAFERQFASARTNFNKKPSVTGTDKGEYPQGKNAFKPQVEKVISTSTKPRKPVCIGNDCGCTSGNSK